MDEIRVNSNEKSSINPDSIGINRREFFKQGARAVVKIIGATSALNAIPIKEALGVFDLDDKVINEKRSNLIKDSVITNSLPYFMPAGRWESGFIPSIQAERPTDGMYIKVVRPGYDKDERMKCSKEIKGGYSIKIVPHTVGLAVDRLWVRVSSIGPIELNKFQRISLFKKGSSSYDDTYFAQLAEDSIIYYVDTDFLNVALFFKGGGFDKNEQLAFDAQEVLEYAVSKEAQTVFFRHFWIDIANRWNQDKKHIICYEYKYADQIVMNAYRIEVPLRTSNKKFTVESIYNVSSIMEERRAEKKAFGSMTLDESLAHQKLRRKFETQGIRVDEADPYYRLLSEKTLKYFNPHL